MGMRPAWRAAIFSVSVSTQITSLPRSANTAPVTRPTYPVPTTQMFMRAVAQNYNKVGPRAGCANLRAPAIVLASFIPGGSPAEEDPRVRNQTSPPRCSWACPTWLRRIFNNQPSRKHERPATSPAGAATAIAYARRVAEGEPLPTLEPTIDVLTPP